MNYRLIRDLKILRVVLLVSLLSLFFVRGINYLDPDFGWHIRMGQLILSSGIPRIDPFSYTMPSYHYIDHEWLTDVLMAKVFSWFQMYGLSLIYALLVLSSILLAIPTGLELWGMIPIFLTGSILLSFAGVRPQLVTWFFTAIVLRVVTDPKLWKKLRFYLPLVFLLWANMHGGFLLGLGILVSYLYISVSKGKLDRFDLMVIGASFLATLINPYGYHLWEQTLKETYLLTTNPYIKQSIDEWTPIYIRYSFNLFFFFITSLVLIFKYWKSFNGLSLVLFFVLTLAAFSSRRQIPLWILSSIPLYSLALKNLFQEKWIGKFNWKGINLTLVLMIFISLGIFTFQARNILHESFSLSENFRYPEAALKFLKLQHYPGKIFAPYLWAGYIEWKDPGQKMFVDGRMATWIRDPNPNESQWAYKDFNDLIAGRLDAAQVVDKYGVGIVIWPTTQYQDVSFTKSLINLGWKKVYKDPISTILKKPKFF